MLASCTRGEKKEEISVKWENGKAVAILVPRIMLDKLEVSSLSASLLVNLRPNDKSPAIASRADILGKYALMGNYELNHDYAIFTPVMPFTNGLGYEVRFNGKLLGVVKIPVDQTQKTPAVVLAVYPLQDTLPENLLKFYIHFSKPMYGGRALDHITLIKNGKDTLRNVFLDMTTELWNTDNTILTLWLDPGRIKRDLQPNKEMGPPLEVNTNYELIIHTQWNSPDDTMFTFRKKFFTGKPDYVLPDINKWTIDLPPDLKSHLVIFLDESLDIMLLENTIQISDSLNKLVKGKIAVYKYGTLLKFTPDTPWSPGKYTLEVESRLEDMAGNNLNRLFDNDLSKQGNKSERKIFTRRFTIK